MMPYALAPASALPSLWTLQATSQVQPKMLQQFQCMHSPEGLRLARARLLTSPASAEGSKLAQSLPPSASLINLSHGLLSGWVNRHYAAIRYAMILLLA